MRETIDDLGGDDAMHMLWQVFVPGSWTEEPSFVKEVSGVNQRVSISKVFVKSWAPLVHNKPVLEYSTGNGIEQIWGQKVALQEACLHRQLYHHHRDGRENLCTVVTTLPWSCSTPCKTSLLT